MNATQLEFRSAPPASQNARVLSALRTFENQWVPMPTLEMISGSHRVNSRVSDLRKHGHSIENRTERAADGACMSFYRLVV
jgi:hypothetical protein